MLETAATKYGDLPGIQFKALASHDVKVYLKNSQSKYPQHFLDVTVLLVSKRENYYLPRFMFTC